MKDKPENPKTMKQFKDLKFESHPVGEGLSAKLFFKNGYGVSVIRFSMSIGRYGSYTSNESEWELAVLLGNEDAWSLTYDTEITDDVMGHLSNMEVTDIMKRIQQI